MLELPHKLESENLFSKNLENISEKVFSLKRIDNNDCLTLLQTSNYPQLFSLANFLREKNYSNYTTYSVTRHINYSNVCKLRCRFCNFRKDENSKEVKRLKIDEILGLVDELKDEKCVEIHITGGLDKQFSFYDALNLIREIKKIRSDAIIKSFTMVEIDYFAKSANLSDEDVFWSLKECGVSSFPGGGAENFSESVRKKICPEKIDGNRWLELAKKAHKIGFKTNATMLYGIGETPYDIIYHLECLRDLQDETGGFMSFIPLLFQKENTPFSHLKDVSLLEQLKIYAVSRIYLDNFPHIKSHWVMAGLKAAELSQWTGVDDIEGTVYEERIAHAAGAKTPTMLKKEQLISLINSAFRIPVERDGLYRILKKD